MNNLFITLTESASARKIRLQVGKITGYATHIPIYSSEDNKEKMTVVYIDHPENPAILVEQTPEEIDTILSHSYVTVRNDR